MICLIQIIYNIIIVIHWIKVNVRHVNTYPHAGMTHCSEIFFSFVLLILGGARGYSPFMGKSNE